MDSLFHSRNPSHAALTPDASFQAKTPNHDQSSSIPSPNIDAIRRELPYFSKISRVDAPSYFRLIRMNTQLHTKFGGNSYCIEDPLNDLNLSVFKDKQAKIFKTSSSSTDELRELLKDYIKVRESTRYELIDDKIQITYSEDIRKMISGLLYIKNAISELSELITKNIAFEVFIMIVILINTFTLALDSIYMIPGWIDMAFLIIYTIECVLKIFSLGLVLEPGTYLRDKWNILDITIVITGWVQSIAFKLNVLRALRILRPLRNISSIKGMKVIFMALIKASSPLVGTLGVLFFFIIIFSITGLETMCEKFTYRCMDLETGIYGADIQRCGSDQCPDHLVCVESLKNPNLGQTSFDNIFYSIVQVFELVTLQTWVPLMNIAQRTVDYAVILFYLPVSYIGAFLIINLSLAVIKSSFTKSMEKIKAKAHKKRTEAEKLEETLDYSIGSNSPKLENEEPDTLNNIFSIETENNIETKNKLMELHDIKANDIPVFEHKRSRGRSSNARYSIIKTFSKSEGQKNAEKISARKVSKREIIVERGNRKNSIILSFSKGKKNKIQEKLLGNIDEASGGTVISKQANETHSMKRISLKKKYKVHIGMAGTLTQEPNAEQGLRRLDSADDLSPSYFFSKLKYIIKIRKSIIKKIKQGVSIGEIKILLGEIYNTTSTSTEEVIPLLAGFDKILLEEHNNYSFTYKGVLCDIEDSLEKKWRLDFEMLMTKYSEFIIPIQIFSYLSLKYGAEDAFCNIMGRVLERVKCIEFEDELQGNVEGHWSGFEIINDDSRNKHFYENLATMKYRLWGPHIIGKYQQLQFLARKLEANRIYFFSMITCVFLNAIVLSLDHYGISQEMSTTLFNLNLAFTSIFTLEIVVKFLSSGAKKFSRDTMNYVDFFVITLSWLEVILNFGSTAITAFRVIRVFRIFRVTRIAKIFRYFAFMKSLIFIITYSLQKFIYLALLLVLINTIYALLGNQIFGGHMHGEVLPRSNFENFGWAYLSVFQILTLSAYSEILYEVMHSSAGPWSALYVIMWIVIGNFILLNLFIAILLDSFTVETADNNIETMSKTEKSLYIHRSSTLFHGNDNNKTLRKREIEKMRILEALNNDENNYDETGERLTFEDVGCRKSYCLLSKSNNIRVFLYKAFKSNYFEAFMFVIIYSNCIVIVWETYLIAYPTDHPQVRATYALETCFTIIYIIEFLMKSISLGFVDGENAYLRDSWNVLDFIILIFSLLDTFTSFLNISIIKVFRVIRAARPLRFISKNKSMKNLVSALMSSLGAMVNVIIVIFIVWFMFAILGVSLFSGKQYECENHLLENEAECYEHGYEWKDAEFSFDNIFEAFLTLFVVSLLELWQEIMYSCIDAREQGLARVRDYNIAASYYFIIFIFIGSFFFLHLFMGVVFMKFHQSRKEEFSVASLFLSQNQQFWVEMQKLVIKSTPQHDIIKEPEGSLRRFIYNIATSAKFEIFIIICILLNMISMAMTYSHAPNSYILALEIINIIFVIIFTIEIILKMLSFGAQNYFRSRWNIFDFCVVICAYIDIIASSNASLDNRFLRTGPQIFRIFRIFRVSRLLRIFKPLKSLHNLLAIVEHSLPSILSVVSFLILNIFIFSIIGVFLFNEVHEGRGIDKYNNFSNFFSAALVLVRCATICDWPYFLIDTMEHSGKITAGLYFTAYMSITILVIVNLFIMVIVQNYEDFESNPDSALHMFTKDERKFKKIWENYSKDYHGIKINYKKVLDFMYSLGNRLGFESSINFDRSISLLSKMAFVIEEDGSIFYHEMLYAVLKRKYGNVIDEDDRISGIILRKEESKTISQLKSLRNVFEWRLFKKSYDGDESEFLLKRKKTRNVLVELVYMRRVFKGWKNVIAKVKTGHIEELSDFSQNID